MIAQRLECNNLAKNYCLNCSLINYVWAFTFAKPDPTLPANRTTNNTLACVKIPRQRMLYQVLVLSALYHTSTRAIDTTVPLQVSKALPKKRSDLHTAVRYGSSPGRPSSFPVLLASIPWLLCQSSYNTRRCAPVGRTDEVQTDSLRELADRLPSVLPSAVRQSWTRPQTCPIENAVESELYTFCNNVQLFILHSS